ncbi:hypothetical protein JOB18_039140 [Solea senegalensis]|uniref:Nuclease HARBI1 n=1 Tax=Solea senegalensis TaxID=28829 RepID=A0AAV6QZR6_SOLSE|nr:hypothetical protein JOB18_039140 [Solea senegalensis]
MRVTCRSQSLITQFLNIYITFPGHHDPQRIKETFYAIAGFPNVLGCIDCSHVRIVAPSGPVERDYVDRRNHHSLNVQGVAPERACDITVACAIVHNIATVRKERLLDVTLEERWEDPNPMPEDMDGRAVRDLYKDAHFG